LPNGGVALGGFQFFICQYDGDRLVYINRPTGVANADAYFKYSAALPGGGCKLLYWDQNMTPVFDAELPV
jgi:hypothetical protein